MVNPHRPGLLALAAAGAAMGAASPYVLSMDEASHLPPLQRAKTKDRTFKDRYGVRVGPTPPAKDRTRARSAAMAGRKANIRRLQRERR